MPGGLAALIPLSVPRFAMFVPKSSKRGLSDPRIVIAITARNVSKQSAPAIGPYFPKQPGLGL